MIHYKKVKNPVFHPTHPCSFLSVYTNYFHGDSNQTVGLMFWLR
jgi:hypothetical protein